MPSSSAEQHHRHGDGQQWSVHPNVPVAASAASAAGNRGQKTERETKSAQIKYSS